MRLLLSLVFLWQLAEGSHPVFDYRTRMRVLLLPADLRPGSVVYRLRGTDADFDYPLRFSVADDVGKSVVRIENMPCNPTHTYCQANVFLARKLEPDRIYDLILSLKDSTGRETKVDSTIKAMRATSHFEDVFPYVPKVIVVPESTKIGTVLDYVLAKKNPVNSHHSYLELWGSEKFRIVQNLSTKDLTNGSIVLTGELDFEEKNMYTLHVFCLDPYTKTSEDTRNVAGFQLPVIVEDDQDMPPDFVSLPPVTRIGDKLQVGEKVLGVQAQDGDRGNPRSIRYSLVDQGDAVASYFNISEKTGDIFLAKPLEELVKAAKGHDPIILTVSAEEVKKNEWDPHPMSATTQVALLLDNHLSNSAPYFQNEQYSARIDENSPQGTPLLFGEPHSTQVRDDDSGKNGVFSLSLENNNGTFEVSPTVGEHKANFVIRVRNNELLDFEERSYVHFTVVATEVTPAKGSTAPLQSRANVTVYLNDQNDNPPVFLQDKYEAEIPENVTAGTVITQVQATDVDTGTYGKVLFTNILGNVNQSLTVDSTTGVIAVATNNHGFDRESAQEYRLLVEAKDMEGTGNRATVPLVIKLLDVNDETPRFERQTFEFILQPNLRNFTTRAFVKAVDDDAEKPNNIVRYEIISGNYENKFALNEITGELLIRGKAFDGSGGRADDSDNFYESKPGKKKDFESDREISSVIVLTVRAYDLGVPHRWANTYVRIYPPESRARNMNFIVSGSGEDRRAIEDLLRQLTGGRVSIQDVRPYTGRESGTDLSWKYAPEEEKKVVAATVFYDGNSFVDLNQVEKKLTKNKTQAIVEEQVTEYRNKNRVLFWLMMFFLLLLLLILLILFLCCIWQGFCSCPILEGNDKRIVSPMENVRFITHERGKIREGKKDIQALTYYGRREAWSGRNGDRTISYDQNLTRDRLVRPIKLEENENFGVAGAGTYRSHSNMESEGPNVIYSREFVENGKDRNATMVVEDVEINPYATKTTIKRTVHQGNANFDRGSDSGSIRRLSEAERASELGKSIKKSDEEGERSKGVEGYQRAGQNTIKEYRVVLERPGEGNASDVELVDVEGEDSTREHYYIRDGNAEILRLVSGGNRGERAEIAADDRTDHGYHKALDKGKDLIMKKFMEDQKQTSSSASREEFQQQLIRRIRKEFEDRHSDGSYPNPSEGVRRLGPSKPAEVGSNHDSESRLVGYHYQNNQETQSLPGQMEISTQTEREFGTQTDEEPMSLRPPRRKVRSDNEFSDEGEYFGGSNENKLDPGKGWIQRDAKNFHGKHVKRHKMRTPILEEGEIEGGIKYDTRPAMFKIPNSQGANPQGSAGPGGYTENKSSILRRRKMKEKAVEEERPAGVEDRSSGDESVREVRPTGRTRRSRRDQKEEGKKDSEMVPGGPRSDSLTRLYEVVQELGDSELERIKVETKERAASLNRFYNALRVLEAESGNDIKKATSLNSLGSDRSKKGRPKEKPSSSDAENGNGKDKRSQRKPADPSGRRNSKENSDEAESLQDSDRPIKPKKSKYMDWYNEMNAKKGKGKKGLGKKERKKEDDLDSGIAMSSLAGTKSNEPVKGHQAKTKTEHLLEKKSVFTIAYDEVKTKSIRPDTNSSEKR